MQAVSPTSPVLDDHGSRLLLALLISVCLHGPIFLLVQASESPTEAAATEPEPTESEPETIKPGDAEPSPTRIAWISYDTYQQLLARESSTRQPAVQATATPVPGAPMNVTPTAEAPTPSASTPPSPQMPTTSEATVDPVPADPLPNGQTDELTQPPLLPEPAPASQPPSPQAIPPAPPGPDRPTSLPRTTREAPPTNLTPALAIQPGRVLAREGLRIDTVAPRFTIAARSIIPSRNPVALITFDTQGVATHVTFLRSTGLAIHDGPIERSLYRYRASGSLIDNATTPISFEITLLLLRPSQAQEQDSPDAENND
ncbi:hypothetical protein [Mucisphaera sp.]|uniref:hypothetical protein n=1 Tax=Mucisphaera sp. TaxID=2913024 RepID=UPI003D0C1E35